MTPKNGGKLDLCKIKSANNILTTRYTTQLGDFSIKLKIRTLSSKMMKNERKDEHAELYNT